VNAAGTRVTKLHVLLCSAVQSGNNYFKTERYHHSHQCSVYTRCIVFQTL